MRPRHFLLLACGAAASVTAARGTELTVVRSDARSVVLEYRPEYVPARRLAGAGQELLLVDFRSSSLLDPAGRPGAPDLRCRRVPVSLPTADGNQVRVLAADYEDTAGVVLAPLPQVRSYEPVPYTGDSMVDPFVPSRIVVSQAAGSVGGGGGSLACSGV